MLTTISNALIRRGIPAPNVSPSSDFYVRATALANELSVAYSNGILSADQVNPDTSVGDALIAEGAIIGVVPRNAAGSFGPIVANCSVPAAVPAGAELTDQNGLVYSVSVGGTYTIGDLIPVLDVDGKGVHRRSVDGIRHRAVPSSVWSGPEDGTVSVTRRSIAKLAARTKAGSSS